MVKNKLRFIINLKKLTPRLSGSDITYDGPENRPPKMKFFFDNLIF